MHFAEVEKLDLARAPADGVLDELDHLVVADPSARVMGKCEHPLLDHGCVDGRFHVADRDRAVRPVEVVALPVVGDRRGHLPAEPPDHVGIGIVVHVVDEVPVTRHVLVESLTPVLLNHQLAGQDRVVRREQHEHRGVDPQEVALGRRLVEDFREEPGTDRVHRIAAGHAERHGPSDGARPKQVDAAVVRGLGLGKVVAVEARAGMVVRVSLHGHPLLQPRRQLRIVRIDARGHHAHRGAAVDLLQPLDNRPQEGLVPGRLTHVVDREHDHRFHARFPNPLRRDQLRRIQAHVVRVAELVEVSQTIAVVGDRNRACREQENEPPHELVPSH